MLVAYCCNIIKLREPPKDLITKFDSKESHGRGNDLGYGNNIKYAQWTIRSQVPVIWIYKWDAVHRLNGDGPNIKHKIYYKFLA